MEPEAVLFIERPTSYPLQCSLTEKLSRPKAALVGCLWAVLYIGAHVIVVKLRSLPSQLLHEGDFSVKVFSMEEIFKPQGRVNTQPEMREIGIVEHVLG